jgi:hypothetical protein
MGAVFRPTDVGRGNRKIIKNAIKDLSPDTRDNVIKLLDSWEGKTSGKKLTQMLGKDKVEELSSNIKGKGEDINLSYDGRMRLRNMFKESLTFD